MQDELVPAANICSMSTTILEPSSGACNNGLMNVFVISVGSVCLSDNILKTCMLFSAAHQQNSANSIEKDYKLDSHVWSQTRDIDVTSERFNHQASHVESEMTPVNLNTPIKGGRLLRSCESDFCEFYKK